MSVRARIDNEKQKLRRLILQATTDLLAREGFEQVSIRKVASRIGYSATTIYLYFKNKADLIDHVVDDGFARFMLRLGNTGAGDSPPLRQLVAGMRVYIAFALENPNWYRVTFSSRLGRSNNDAQFLTEAATREKGFAVLAASLTQAMAAGEIPKRPLYPAVQTIWATLHGIAMLLINSPQVGIKEQRRVIEGYIELIVNGLRVR
jgi:AcrR family transcriptional regulator